MSNFSGNVRKNADSFKPKTSGGGDAGVGRVIAGVYAGQTAPVVFEMWQVTMQENFKAAREAMATARIALARCTVEAAKAGERFGGAAHTWAAGEFDAFERIEANPDTLGGFKVALPWYRNVVVHIHPMVRG